ncbi:hypothetical protein H7J88_18545 [Mycolicibacterium flavescens]|uniref:Uncharacterized protein n=1 Tax=Mycolicibacterium flavescens TaxID=1776 RepID=A0A1E3RQN8_MYCFV|nr:hypothetical protein [Mycolicibacterium flavescens]ODQ91722.1 hypothetical protein BHQ18_06260 [Mycolicibacterium flavescens]
MKPIVRRLSAPTRVAVHGRAGVGRRTVAAALTGAGVAVVPDCADVDVLVIAEAPKPEDLGFLDADRPAVVVLNKSDLSGYGPGGPLAIAQRRAARYRTVTGLPTVPMVALLASATPTDDLVAALRVLITEPADLTSTDGFVSGAHPLPAETRARLLAELDRFGIAHAVLALERGATVPALTAHLRDLSQVARVVDLVQAAAAPLRYRRLRRAISEVRAVAAQSGDETLAGLLRADETVLSVMTAAVDVVEAAGAEVDRADDPEGHLRRAVRWRRYGQGPVNALHRACAADISRGSLRLLARAQ